MNINNIVNKYRLNQTEKNILIFLQDHVETTKELGIRGVAKACYTSPATIVNLAKKMNYSGYSELLFKIKDGTIDTNYTLEAQRIDSALDTDLATYQEEFSKLLGYYRNKNIMILASGFSQIIANYMNEKLIIHGFRSISNSHLELIEPLHSKSTLILTVSESGETTSLKEIIEKAHANGIEIISFTGNSHSTIAQASTLALKIKDINLFSNEMNSPHLFYGSTLILFELLISAYLKNEMN